MPDLPLLIVSAVAGAALTMIVLHMLQVDRHLSHGGDRWHHHHTDRIPHHHLDDEP